MAERYVYADNSATTQISDKVLTAMMPYLKQGYGNPSSIYTLGREAKIAIEKAREQVALGVGGAPNEIFFTGCGTESDNWAIKSTARQLLKKGKNHIVTSVFEHHAVLHTVKALEKEGFKATYVKVDSEGYVNPEDVKAAITGETAIVSIMYANNEIGTIQPIAEIGKICREKGVYFHTDAVQAVGNVAIDVNRDNIDMLSLSGHKLKAMKGIGALYIRKGIKIPPFMDGGGQENGKRAGTENTAAIAGLGTAVEEAVKNLEENAKKVTIMRDKLIDNILKLPRTRLNGGRKNRLPGNVNISFEGIEGEALLLMLDNAGISASSGSACTSGSLDPSHVLLSIGLIHEVAHGSLRLSINELNNYDDIEYIIKVLPPIVERLRFMSPLWEKINKGA